MNHLSLHVQAGSPFLKKWLPLGAVFGCQKPGDGSFRFLDDHYERVLVNRIDRPLETARFGGENFARLRDPLMQVTGQSAHVGRELMMNPRNILAPVNPPGRR